MTWLSDDEDFNIEMFLIIVKDNNQKKGYGDYDFALPLGIGI